MQQDLAKEAKGLKKMFEVFETQTEALKSEQKELQMLRNDTAPNLAAENKANEYWYKKVVAKAQQPVHEKT